MMVATLPRHRSTLSQGQGAPETLTACPCSQIPSKHRQLAQKAPQRKEMGAAALATWEDSSRCQVCPPLALAADVTSDTGSRNRCLYYLAFA